MINYIEKHGLHKALEASNLLIKDKGTHWISIVGQDDIINQFIIDFDEVAALRAELKSQLVIESQEYVNEAILKQYPKFEVDTWQNQLRDANSYIADNNAVVPTLEALATQRSISKQSAADKIIAKAVVFEAFSGKQAGERQRLEDLIDLAETVEALNAIPKFAGV